MLAPVFASDCLFAFSFPGSMPTRVKADLSALDVRVGGASDMPGLHKLLSAAGRKLSFTHEHMQADLEAGFFFCLVAAACDELAGAIVYFTLWDVCRCLRLFYMEDFYVQQAWRRCGVGRALMGSLLDLARASHSVAVDFRMPVAACRAASNICTFFGAQYCTDLISIALDVDAMRCVANAEGSDACVTVRTMPSDRGGASQLIRELAAEEGQEEHCVDGPLPLAAEGAADCAGAPPRPDARFLVAAVPRDGDVQEVVGLAVYAPCFSVEVGRCLKLLALVVRTGWRGRGIGRQLMGRLCAEGLELRVRKLQWEVLEGARAMSFYQRLGAQVDTAQRGIEGSFPVPA
ncbi:unnamed protein product [Prorocentrum cordatum]|uniref:N-acetyltransferase domain-containing protein n=1 Tax=Prorocentrum cordatum TaxID=2364126 RepID=A0ABN9R308_9DINO|nr:unnamed protein product [Polarella glacialis]